MLANSDNKQNSLIFFYNIPFSERYLMFIRVLATTRVMSSHSNVASLSQSKAIQDITHHAKFFSSTFMIICWFSPKFSNPIQFKRSIYNK